MPPVRARKRRNLRSSRTMTVPLLSAYLTVYHHHFTIPSRSGDNRERRMTDHLDQLPVRKPTIEPDMFPFFFDAVKMVGTGNSAGLFGAGVALYYFAGRSPTILWYIKAAAFGYLVGVCLFSIAFFLLLITANAQYHDILD